MNEKKILGFDIPTISAIVLTGLIFFGWQTYMAKKYPQMNKKTEVVATENAPVAQEKSEAANSAANPQGQASTQHLEKDQNQKEQV